MMIDLIRGDFLTWNEIIERLNLVEVSEEKTCYKIDAVIKSGSGSYHLFSGTNKIGWLSHHHNSFAINLPSFLIYVKSAMSRIFLVSILNGDLEERFTVPKYKIPVNKILRNLKNDNLSSDLIIKMVLNQ